MHVDQYFTITSVVFSFQNRKYNWFYRESSISSHMRLYVIFEIKYSVCVCVHMCVCPCVYVCHYDHRNHLIRSSPCYPRPLSTHSIPTWLVRRGRWKLQMQHLEVCRCWHFPVILRNSRSEVNIQARTCITHPWFKWLELPCKNVRYTTDGYNTSSWLYY